MKFNRFILPLFFLAFYLISLFFHANVVHAGINEWTAIGPNSGCVWSVAISPTNDNVIYASTCDDLYYVFESKDGGATWEETGLLDSFNFDSIMINPLNSNIVYATTTYGIYKSTNALINWEFLTLPDVLWTLVFHPMYTTILYAGTMSGVYRSIDGGINWERISSDLADVGVYSLAFDPKNPNSIYAATYNKGVFKSIDGGANWTYTGLGDNSSITAIVIDPVNTNIIYVGSLCYGVLKSADSGKNWNIMNLSYAVWNLAIDPQNHNVIYAATGAGVFKSKEGGENWIALNTGLPNIEVHTLAIDPANPNILYAGTWDGLFKIEQVTNNDITIVSPNGEETLMAGSTQTIQWSYGDNPGTRVRIELLKGGMVNRTIASRVSRGSAGIGSFSWKIPSNQSYGIDYQIRVTSTSNVSYTDTSDNNFTILGLPPLPTNVSASDGTYPDRVEVTWTASPGATSYTVYRATSLSRFARKTALGTTSATSLNDTTAIPGRTYYYWVKASNTYGTSDFSSYDAGHR